MQGVAVGGLLGRWADEARAGLDDELLVGDGDVERGAGEQLGEVVEGVGGAEEEGVLHAAVVDDHGHAGHVGRVGVGLAFHVDDVIGHFDGLILRWRE